jgi:hypothetical protein
MIGKHSGVPSSANGLGGVGRAARRRGSHYPTDTRHRPRRNFRRHHDRASPRKRFGVLPCQMHTLTLPPAGFTGNSHMLPLCCTSAALPQPFPRRSS